MPCNNNCKKDASVDRATVVVSTLLVICLCSIGYGLYKLSKGVSGSPCAVEVQFTGSKATYIGTSL